MTEKQQTRFQRANFVVRDIDKALSFYEGVLGFEVTFRKGHNPDSYSIPVFEIPDGAELDFVILSLPKPAARDGTFRHQKCPNAASTLSTTRSDCVGRC